MTACAGQLDLLELVAELEQILCSQCRHEEPIHYPDWAGTKGCRVFTCWCKGWKPQAAGIAA